MPNKFFEKALRDFHQSTLAKPTGPSNGEEEMLRD
jgi:hypothetical protein